MGVVLKLGVGASLGHTVGHSSSIGLVFRTCISIVLVFCQRQNMECCLQKGAGRESSNSRPREVETREVREEKAATELARILDGTGRMCGNVACLT